MQYKLKVRGQTTPNLTTSFAEIADKLRLPEREEPDQTKIVRAVLDWLESNDGWLLVYDNADDPAILNPDDPATPERFVPNRPKGHILITSRAQVLTGLGVKEPFPLDVLPEEKAVEFLFERTGCKRDDPVEQAAARELAREVESLPLALEQAGAFIRRNRSTLARYLQSYRARGLDLLDEADDLMGKYGVPVTKTWLLNFEAVEEESKAAADLLRFTAFVAPDNIPYELVAKGASELGPELASALKDAKNDPASLDRLFGVLDSGYSLVRCDARSQTYSIHRLVQEVVKRNMDEKTRRTWAERTVRVLNAAFPSVKVETWPLCDRLVPHAKAAAALIEAWRFEFPEAGRLLNQAGYYLHERARYAEAEPLYQRALSIHENVVGPEHPDTATSLNNLALLYSDQGRFAEAEPLYRRALEIREKVLGAEHPDTAQSLNNLAGLYYAQGRFAEAEPLYRRALGIHEKALGPDHPGTATSLNNLALLYDSEGRYAEAEPLYRRALSIREKALGPEHPNTATSLNNLAALYYSQGRFAEAEPLYRRALQIDEKVYGPNHPEVATDLNNLAALHDAQGRCAEAEPFYRRALAIDEKAYGPNHPDTATDLNNLGVLYGTQGKFGEALPLLERALKIREKALRQDHPDVALSLENCAYVLRKLNRDAEAAELEARARAIREKHAARERGARGLPPDETEGE